MSARLSTVLVALLLAALPTWAQGQSTTGKQMRVSVGIGSADGQTISHTSASGSYYAGGESVSATKPVTGDVVAAGGSVEVSASVAENAVLAGGNLSVNQRVGQSVIAAGGNVNVNQRVEQDVIAAGGNVSLAGPVGDDVRAAGGSVSIGNSVGGDVLAAGGNVALQPSATVGGEAWLAGGTVEVNGTVAHDVHVRAEEVRLNGTVRGNVDLTAESVTIGPAARVEGKLVYASPKAATIDPAARITGGVERRPVPPEGIPGPHWAGFILAGVLGFLTLLVTATVLRWVFPRFSVQSAGTLGRHPWKSLALGFALLVCVPAAAVVLFVLVLGTPLGLSLLLLYPIALALGWFVIAVWIAEWLGARFFGRRGAPRGWQVLLLWGAVLVMALVCLIPWLGPLLLFVALLFGLGALGLHLAARYGAGGAAPEPR
ncbi:MAG TPA: hypothetical protein VKB51_14980 [bacterium]|nr:hypothetical protein [bacterium]